MDPEPYDVLAVELSSFQLHYTRSMAAESAAVLNVAEDHLDWYDDEPAWPDPGADGHGGLRRRQGPHLRRRAAGLRLQRRGPRDRATWSARPTSSRARARSASPSACPPSGMLGVVDDVLADRAFIEERATSAAELCTLADLASPAPHIVANALAAAALARAHGVASRRCATGCGRSARRPPDRPRRGGRRRDLGRRLQGHQPARRPGVPAPPTSTSCGSPAAWPRARGSTTWWPRWAAGCAASCCSAGTAR